MVVFEELYVLQLAEDIADDVWKMVFQWNAFIRDVIGKQLIRSADSIGANIAEAFGRYHYGDKINFLYYARGSVFETKYWLNRALKRDIIESEIHRAYAERLNEVAKGVNGYVDKIKAYRYGKVQAFKEPGPTYHVRETEQVIFSEAHLAWLLTDEDTRRTTLQHIRQTTTLPNPNPNPNPDPDPDPNLG